MADTRISSGYMAGAGGGVLAAQAFFPIMLTVLEAGETASWLALLLAVLTAIALYLPVAAVLSRTAGSGLIALAHRAGGRAMAIGIALAIGGLLIIHTGLIIREVSEMTVSAIYPHTPQTFVMTSLTVCALAGAYGSIASLVRTTAVFLGPFIGAILLLLVFNLGWGQVRYVLPLWGPGPVPLLLHSVLLSGWLAPVVLYLLVMAGRVQDRAALPRVGILALGGAGALLVVSVLQFLLTYPLPLSFSVTFPLHAIARLVIGGRFFERIEGVWVAFWFYATACHLAATLQAAAVAFAEAFRMPSHRAAVIPLTFIALTVAIMPPDQGRTIAWHAALVPYGLVLGLLIPLLLAAAALLRSRPGGRHAR